MQTSITKHRDAFTLIELLVVIGIILLIAALGVTMLPRFQQDQKVQRGSDQLQQYLLIAKQCAKRDLLATGIRLYMAPAISSTRSPTFNSQRPLLAARVARVT